MRALASLALTLALSACAARLVPWQHPSLPKDQWASDWSTCRRAADDRVGYQDYSEDSVFRDYDRAQAKKRVDAIAGGCMRDLGYIPLSRR